MGFCWRLSRNKKTAGVMSEKIAGEDTKTESRKSRNKIKKR